MVLTPHILMRWDGCLNLRNACNASTQLVYVLVRAQLRKLSIGLATYLNTAKKSVNI